MPLLAHTIRRHNRGETVRFQYFYCLILVIKKKTVLSDFDTSDPRHHEKLDNSVSFFVWRGMSSIAMSAAAHRMIARAPTIHRAIQRTIL